MSDTLKESVKEGKRLTAGLIFIRNTYRLGRSLLDIQEDKFKQKQTDAIKAGNRAYDTYVKRMAKANDIRKKKSDFNSWTKSDFKIINMSLKRKGDEGVKKELVDLKAQYSRWKDRSLLLKENFVSICDTVDDDGNSVDDDSDGAESDEDAAAFKDVHTRTAAV